MTGLTPHEVAVLSNLEPVPVTCDWDACGVPASWWMVCTRCRFRDALCEGHRHDLDHRDTFTVTRLPRSLRRRIVLNVHACTNCGTGITVSTWRTLFDVYPIRDAS